MQKLLRDITDANAGRENNRTWRRVEIQAANKMTENRSARCCETPQRSTSRSELVSGFSSTVTPPLAQPAPEGDKTIHTVQHQTAELPSALPQEPVGFNYHHTHG